MSKMKLHATAFTRRRCLTLGAAALVVSALPLRLRAAETAAQDASQATPAAAVQTPLFESLDMDWLDSVRQRPVPVRLYLPKVEKAEKADNAPAQVPLMVFSHGIGGSRRGYSYLGQHVASHGIASLHLQHVGSDRALWTGNPFSLVGRLQDAAQEAEAVNRVLDFKFALDTLLADPAHAALARRVDAGRIVAAGHSYGANTTLMASGARVPRPGKVIDLHDPRVRAAIAISSPPFYGQAEPTQILAGINVPSLHVTATEDIIRIPGYYSGSEDRIKVFDATGGPRKWLAVYTGGSHSMFTDRSGTGGTLLNPQVKAATQALVLAFVRSVFEGDEAAITHWPQRHAAIVSRFDRVVRG
jgi:predicted dienelactone hydrolase